MDTIVRMFSHDPRFLCRQHLLGEHYESHMIASALLKGYVKGLQGLAKTGKIAIHDLKRRHDSVEVEMRKRGMNPVAAFPDVEGKLWFEGEISAAECICTLFVRCPDCRERIPMDVFKLCRKAITPEIVERIIRDEMARRVEGKNLVADLSLLETT